METITVRKSVQPLNEYFVIITGKNDNTIKYLRLDNLDTTEVDAAWAFPSLKEACKAANQTGKRAIYHYARVREFDGEYTIDLLDSVDESNILFDERKTELIRNVETTIIDIFAGFDEIEHFSGTSEELVAAFKKTLDDNQWWTPGRK